MGGSDRHERQMWEEQTQVGGDKHGEGEMNRRKSRVASWLAGILFVVALLAGGGILCQYAILDAPYRMEADCRGLGIDMEAMKHREESGRYQTLGIITIAGWRIEKQQSVTSVSTGRKAAPTVMAVYGSMELVIPSSVLSGRYGLDTEGEFCVLSEGLARRLFGSTEVAGECVKTEEGIYIVSGVIRREEEFLMIPAKEGPVEEVAVKAKGWMGAREALKRVKEGKT